MYEIFEILLFKDTGERLGRVHTEYGLRTFPLGVVGEELRPYMGTRNGYEIAMPPHPPLVTLIDTDAAPDANGYYPVRPAAFAALGAPDISLANWGRGE